ncbi:MAG: YHYH protein [Saprospiraceae bacterium]|nr:YHYH protein [Saprospiraceae bacterium]
MLKPYLTIAFSLSCLIQILAHDPNAPQGALREFHLKNKGHIHGSFLMSRNDSVFLETHHGHVKSWPVTAFSQADQRYFQEKTEQINAINRRLEAARNQAQVMPYPENQSDSKHVSAWTWLLWGFVLLCMGAAVYLVLQKRTRMAFATFLAAGAVLVSFKSAMVDKLFSTDPIFMDSAFQPFKPHVKTHWDNNWFYVESNGIPTTHPMMAGITKWQQQVPTKQCYLGSNAWQIPLNPMLADTPVPVNQQHFLRGAVAIAANGIPIFNPYTNTGIDAFLDGQLDQWGGHCGRADDYHYHIAPMFLDTQTVDILPIAFALDGFAIYAGQEPDGSPMQPLDGNHGHFDALGAYHYHGTPQAPYMIGKMVGKVTEDSTLQIIPQAKAMPVRPFLQPLNGAVITNCQPQVANNGYVLTYTRNGQTYQVDYSWTPTGIYTFNFVSPTGTTTQTYNGHTPCDVPVATNDLFEQKLGAVVFPNPTSGSITLKINESFANRPQKVFLYDANGKQVYQAQNPESTLELHGLNKGMYILQVVFEHGEISRKIAVQ